MKTDRAGVTESAKINNRVREILEMAKGLPVLTTMQVVRRLIEQAEEGAGVATGDDR